MGGVSSSRIRIRIRMRIRIFISDLILFGPFHNGKTLQRTQRYTVGSFSFFLVSFLVPVSFIFMYSF